MVRTMNPLKTITTRDALIAIVRLLRAVKVLRVCATVAAESGESEKRIAALTAIVFLDDALEQLKRVFESLNVIPARPFETLHQLDNTSIVVSHTDVSFALAARMREELDGTVGSDEAMQALRGALPVRIVFVRRLFDSARQVLNV
jgi:hypothetical protein